MSRAPICIRWIDICRKDFGWWWYGCLNKIHSASYIDFSRNVWDFTTWNFPGVVIIILTLRAHGFGPGLKYVLSWKRAFFCSRSCSMSCCSTFRGYLDSNFATPSTCAMWEMTTSPLSNDTEICRPIALKIFCHRAVQHIVLEVNIQQLGTLIPSVLRGYHQLT